MKIYVDVLPRNEERKVNKETNSIKLEFGTHFEIDGICTTQSLKDKIRERTIEEVLDIIVNNFGCGNGDDDDYIDEPFICIKECVYKAMKGESNVKD